MPYEALDYNFTTQVDPGTPTVDQVNTDPTKAQGGYEALDYDFGTTDVRNFTEDEFKATEETNNRLGFLKYAGLQFDMTELHSNKVDVMKRFNNGELTIDEVRQTIGTRQEQLKKKYGIDSLDAQANNSASFIFGTAYGQVPNVRDVAFEGIPYAALAIPLTMMRNQALTAAGAAVGSVLPGAGTAIGAAAGEVLGKGEAVVEGLNTAGKIAAFVDTAEKEGYGFYYDAVITHGIEPKEAAVASSIVGLLNGSVELISFSAATSALRKTGFKIAGKTSKDTVLTGAKTLAKELGKNPAARKVAGTFVAEIAKVVGAEVTTEEIQEIVNVVGELSTGREVSKEEVVRRLKDAGLSAAAASLVFGSFNGTLTVATQRIDMANEKVAAPEETPAVTQEVAEKPAEAITKEEQLTAEKQRLEDIDQLEAQEFEKKKETEIVSIEEKEQRSEAQRIFEEKRDKIDKEIQELSEAKEVKEIKATKEKEATAVDQEVQDLAKQKADLSEQLANADTKTEQNKIQSQINKADKQLDKAMARSEALAGELQLIEEEGFKAVEDLKTAKVSESRLVTLRGRAIKSTLSAFKKGIREGIISTKEQIREVQTEMSKFIAGLPLDQNQKNSLKGLIKEIQTPAQFLKKLPEIQKRVDRIQTQVRNKELDTQIKKELKVKPVVKREGKFDIETNKAVQELKNINKLGVAEASNKLNELRTVVADKDVMSARDTLLNKMLTYKAMGAKASTELRESLLSDIQKLKQLGREAKEEFNFEKAFGKLQNEEETIQAVEERKDTVSEREANLFTENFGSLFSMLRLMGGEKLARRFNLENARTTANAKAFNMKSELNKKLLDALNITNKNYLRFLFDTAETQYEMTNTETQEKLQLNKRQVMKIYLDLKDEQTAKNYYRVYGEEVVHSLVGGKGFDGVLTPEERAFADELQKTVLSLGPQVNKVMIDMFGVEVPLSETYFPRYSERDLDATLVDKDGLLSQFPSFIKERQDKVTPVPLDALEVTMRYIQDANFFVHAGSTYQSMLDTFVNNKNVKASVKNAYGVKFYNRLVKKIRDGGLKARNQRQSEYSGFLKSMLNNWAMVQVFSETVFTKQTISASNYAAKMPIKEWGKYTAEFWLDPISNTKKMWKRFEFLRARFGQGYDDNLATILAQKEAFFGVRRQPKTRVGKVVKEMTFTARAYDKVMTNALLTPSKVGDMWAIIGGGYAYVRHLENQGLSEQQIVEEFQTTTIRSQQNRDVTSLSEIQQDQTLSLFARFKNTAFQYSRLLYENWIDYRRGDISQVEFNKVAFNYAVVQPLMYVAVGEALKNIKQDIKEGIAGEEDEEKKFDETEFFFEAMAQMLFLFTDPIPLLNDLVRNTYGNAVGLDTYDMFQPQFLSDLNRSITSFNKASDREDTANALYALMRAQEPVTKLPLKKIYEYLDIISGGSFTEHRESEKKRTVREKRRAKRNGTTKGKVSRPK